MMRQRWLREPRRYCLVLGSLAVGCRDAIA